MGWGRGKEWGRGEREGEGGGDGGGGKGGLGRLCIRTTSWGVSPFQKGARGVWGVITTFATCFVLRGKADGDAEEEGLVHSYHLTGRFSFSFLLEGVGVVGRGSVTNFKVCFMLLAKADGFVVILCG